MTEKLRIFIADPAGNRTIFVLSSVERKYYSSLSEKLLSLEQLVSCNILICNDHWV